MSGGFIVMSDRDAALARLSMRLLLGVTPLEHDGKRIGRLTLREYVAGGMATNRNAHWVCVCDCGAITKARSDNLRNGRTRSCGGAGCRDLRTNRTAANESSARKAA